MSMKNHHNRTSNNYTEVADKLFFNKSYSSVPSMRQAAKRFVLSPEFTQDCAYYEGHMIDGKWQFRPCGKEMKCTLT